MDALPWFWIWIIAAAVLFIGEMLSLSFFLLPFAIGAVVAAVLNAFGVAFVWQVVVFVIVSVIALVALRPFAHRITKKASHVKAGAERLVGMQGAVVKGQSATREFRVMVGGELWNASTTDGIKLEPGVAIEVLAVNSNSLVVKALPQEEQPATSQELEQERKDAHPKSPLDAPQFVEIEEKYKTS